MFIDFALDFDYRPEVRVLPVRAAYPHSRCVFQDYDRVISYVLSTSVGYFFATVIGHMGRGSFGNSPWFYSMQKIIIFLNLYNRSQCVLLQKNCKRNKKRKGILHRKSPTAAITRNLNIACCFAIVFTVAIALYSPDSCNREFIIRLNFCFEISLFASVLRVEFEIF